MKKTSNDSIKLVKRKIELLFCFFTFVSVPIWTLGNSMSSDSSMDDFPASLFTTIVSASNGNDFVQKRDRKNLFAFPERQITGKVTDSTTGEPLAGVTVKIKDGGGTITDVDGKFSLKVENGDVLVISYLGYNSKEIPVKNKSTLDILLTSSATGLNQLVVIGYGKEKKKNVVGAISSVDGAEMEKAPVLNAANSIEGRIPGVFAHNRSGVPGGASTSISIRGSGTLNNNGPLIVIDGVPSTMQDFSTLNPSVIESVTALKGVSAAIYGSESANGVILVTTKDGEEGTPKITYDGSVGFNQPTRLPKLVVGWQYMKWNNELNKALGRPETYSDQTIESLKDGSYNPRQYANTDWLDAIIKPFSLITSHRLQISGGSKTVTYLISGKYAYQDGIFKKSAFNYSLGNLRSNIRVKPSENLNISLKTSYKRQDINQSNHSAEDIMLEATDYYPFLPPFFPNGYPSGALDNPVLEAQGKTGFYKVGYNLFQSVASFDWQLPSITKGLYLKGDASYSFVTEDHKRFNNQYDQYVYDPTTDSYENERKNQGPLDLTVGNDRSHRLVYNLQLGYKNSFGHHNVSAFVAYSQDSYRHNWISGYRQGFLSDEVLQLGLGAEDLQTVNGSADQLEITTDPNGYRRRLGGTRSYFGRFTYNYKEKYLFEFTLRRDGSYRFAPHHRWGTFPAFSAGWVISDEPFFKEDFGNIVSNLKLRASWGELGSDLISPFQYEEFYSFGSGYVFNEDYNRGFVPGVAPNPSITWEVARKRDVGINIGLLNGALQLEADYFSQKRNNILVAPNGTVPNYTGLSLPDQNIGKVNNHGFDASLSYRNQSHQIHYRFYGNVTYAKNKIVYMPEAKDIPSYQKQIGHPMGSWLLYKAEGIYKNQEEIDSRPHLAGTQPGDIIYKDINGDGKITSDDEMRIFKSNLPKIQYGVGTDWDYKGISLNLFFQGQGAARQLVQPGIQSIFSAPLWLYNQRWTSDNPNAKYPHPYNREDSHNNRPSTLWLENAWFVRLKTARVSYSLPQKWVSRINFDKVMFYVSGQNLFTISSIKHYDPELDNSGTTYYPQVRILTAGLSFTF